MLSFVTLCCRGIVTIISLSECTNAISFTKGIRKCTPGFRVFENLSFLSITPSLCRDMGFWLQWAVG